MRERGAQHSLADRLHHCEGLECDYFYYDEAQCNIPNLGTMSLGSTW